jgi:holliday junction DNA helicase RuvA
MISRLRGKVVEVTDQGITLEVGGIGFLLGMARSQEHKLNEEIELVVHLYWHQDLGPQLFAFKTITEKQLFILLTGCSGVGPKIALSILAHMSIRSFVVAIQGGDSKALSNVDGIGIKKAESMILALKDKVAKMIQTGTLHEETGNFALVKKMNEILLSLGYSRAECLSILESLQKTGGIEVLPFDELVRKALALAKK